MFLRQPLRRLHLHLAALRDRAGDGGDASPRATGGGGGAGPRQEEGGVEAREARVAAARRRGDTEVNKSINQSCFGSAASIKYIAQRSTRLAMLN